MGRHLPPPGALHLLGCITAPRSSSTAARVRAVQPPTRPPLRPRQVRVGAHQRTSGAGYDLRTVITTVPHPGFVYMQRDPNSMFFFDAALMLLDRPSSNDKAPLPPFTLACARGAGGVTGPAGGRQLRLPRPASEPPSPSSLPHPAASRATASLTLPRPPPCHPAEKPSLPKPVNTQLAVLGFGDTRPGTRSLAAVLQQVRRLPTGCPARRCRAAAQRPETPACLPTVARPLAGQPGPPRPRHL